MPDSNSVGLTEVLFGVVIAGAIYEMELAFSFRNAVLLFALGILVGDWVEYQLSTQGLDLSNLQYSAMMVLDIAILLVWYLLTTVPSEQFGAFILLTGIFFVLVGVWSVSMMGASVRDLLLNIDWGADWQIAATFFVLYGVETQTSISKSIVLALMTVVWLGRKTPVWYRLLNRKKANF